MAKRWNRSRWIKMAVLAVGVADCAGIYYAQHRLGQSVPDDVRYDRTAYVVPEDLNQFHAGDTAVFADAAPVASPAAAAPAAALAVAAPVEGPAPAPARATAAAPAPLELAAAAPARPVSAPTLVAPALAARAPAVAAPAAKAPVVVPQPDPTPVMAAAEGPRGSAVSRFLSRLRSATGTGASAKAERPAAVAVTPVAAPARLAAAAPAALRAAVPSPAATPSRAIITPHLARVTAPAPGFHDHASSLTRHDRTASLAMASQAPAAKATRAAPGRTAKAPGAPAASLASLVPAQRERTTFAAAFANIDAPLQPATQLELDLGHPAAAPETGLAAAPTLESVIPAAPAELPTVSASADEANAKL